MANVVNSGSKTRGAKAEEATNLGWMNFKINTKAGIKSFSARAGIPLNDDNDVAKLLVEKLKSLPDDAARTAFLIANLQVTFTEAAEPIDQQASLWD